MADARAPGDSAALDDTDDPLGQSSRFLVPLLKHHTRRGLSVPLELRGVDGVQLADDLVLDSPKVSSKDQVVRADARPLRPLRCIPAPVGPAAAHPSALRGPHPRCLAHAGVAAALSLLHRF